MSGEHPPPDSVTSRGEPPPALAASAAAPPAFVVSMHDVSPLTWDVFAEMLDDLRPLGLTKCSLLVIPDHHRRRHFLTDIPFRRWLEELARAGHELVVHGYYHQRDARPSDTWMQRIVTNVYTLGEGEFHDLPKDEAAGLLALALEEFRDLDVPAPRGFVAPAWLLGDEAAAAVREAGFQYTTWLRGVEDLVRGEFLVSQSLVYSCRNAWRRNASLAWNRFLSGRLRRNPLVRLGLHPPDFEHAHIWRQVRRIVADTLREREAMTYAEFIDRSHPAGPAA